MKFILGVIIIADGKVVIDVILDDGTVTKGVANIDKSIGGLGGAGEKASLSIGKIASALGLVYLAKKGIDLVRDSLDGAIDRYDTLNQFPRVMQMIGFDAEESEAAIGKLSDGIDGLPTTLDSVASTAQNIAVMTGDLDGAVDTTLALNNAFLASGASTADAERGLTQYVQMLSKGEVDLQSWRTLQETMGVALRTVADDFGFTGKAATNDLYEALKSGEITMDEFNNKLVEASNAQGGFADMAAEASGGIKTSWTNMKTAVVKGLADVIGAIDEALGGTGEIEQIIDKMKTAFQVAFAWIVSNIPAVAETIKDIATAAKEVYETIEPWLPLLLSVSAGILVAVKAFQAFTKVKLIIDAIKVSMLALNTTMLANPIFWIVAAIVAAALLIYVYWEPISEFFVGIWNTIKETGLLIWENLKEGWANAVENIKELWNSVTEFFSDLWENIKLVFQMAYDWLNEITDGSFGQYVELIQAYMTTAWEIIKSIWDFVKETFSNVLDFLKALVSGDFEGMKEAIKNQMENAKGLLSDIWNAIKTNIGAKLAEILSNVIAKFIEIKTNIENKITDAKNALVDKFKEMVSNAKAKTMEILTNIISKFNEIKSNITKKLTEAKNNLVNKFVEMKTNAVNKGQEIVNAAKDKFQAVKDGIRDKLTEAVTVVGNKIGEMPGKVMEFFGSMVDSGKGLVAGLINGIKNMAGDAIGAITGVVDGVIGKAKSLLKINSPSKLFEQFGKWTSEGLASGIEKMKGVAERASENLGVSVENAFGPQLEIDGVGALDRIKGFSADALIGNVVPTLSTDAVKRQVKQKGEDKQSTIIIRPSNVEMDGRVVGEITWEVVDENIERRREIVDRFRG